MTLTAELENDLKILNVISDNPPYLTSEFLSILYDKCSTLFLNDPCSILQNQKLIRKFIYIASYVAYRHFILPFMKKHKLKFDIRQLQYALMRVMSKYVQLYLTYMCHSK